MDRHLFMLYSTSAMALEPAFWLRAPKSHGVWAGFRSKLPAVWHVYPDSSFCRRLAAPSGRGLQAGGLFGGGVEPCRGWGGGPVGVGGGAFWIGPCPSERDLVGLSGRNQRLRFALFSLLDGNSSRLRIKRLKGSPFRPQRCRASSPGNLLPKCLDVFVSHVLGRPFGSVFFLKVIPLWLVLRGK